MGDFPSGQRGQTVNLLSLTSVVRIHHPPPKNDKLCLSFFYPSRQAWYIINSQSELYITTPLGVYIISHKVAV